MPIKKPSVVLLILRGRPGLGHVIPGLALARAAYDFGSEIHIATYSNGYKFLQANADIGFKYHLIQLEVGHDYVDWPGLCPYDNGVREILPLWESIHADICIYGGEYILGPILQGSSCRTVSLFNPEILLDSDRNQAPSAYLCRLLACSDFLLPLQDLPAGKLIEEFSLIENKIISAGPFTLPPVIKSSLETQVLIANGGGIEFPSSTASYSSTGVSASTWVAETYEYTRAAILACLKSMKGLGRIYVFSCLSDLDNSRLRLLGDKANLQVEFISAEYYSHLHSADLVISRSGVGFLADVSNIKGAKIVWALSEHDEQKENARNFVQTHENAYYCCNVYELEQLVEKSLLHKAESSNLQRDVGYQRAVMAMHRIYLEGGFLQQ